MRNSDERIRGNGKDHPTSLSCQTDLKQESPSIPHYLKVGL